YKKTRGHAERAGGLDDVRLLEVLLDEWAYEHDVRVLASDQLDDSRVRRDPSLELRQGVPDGAELVEFELQHRITPGRVRPACAARGDAHKPVERVPPAEGCDPLLRREVPGVVARLAQERDRTAERGIGDLVVRD